MKISAIILTCLSLFGWSMVAFAHDSGINMGSEMYNISELDSPPKPIEQVAPVYPPHLKERKQWGVVNLELIVDEVGDVTSVTVLDSTDNAFTRASMKAVVEWRFNPGMKDGEPVKTLVKLPLKFNLKDKKERQVENPQ